MSIYQQFSSILSSYTPVKSTLVHIVDDQAFLGTSNAAGIFWFLTQYATEIGRRLTVSRATVFQYTVGD